MVALRYIILGRGRWEGGGVFIEVSLVDITT